MKGEIIWAALVLSGGIAAHGYFSTPHHTMTRLDDNTVMKLDRWSGTASMCAQWNDEAGNESVYCQRLTEWEEIQPIEPGQQ